MPAIDWFTDNDCFERSGFSGKVKIGRRKIKRKIEIKNLKLLKQIDFVCCKKCSIILFTFKKENNEIKNYLLFRV